MPDSDQVVTVPMDTGRVEEFARVVRDARETGRSEVSLPGYPGPIPLAVAEGVVKTFTKTLDDVKKGRFSTAELDKPKPVERQHLVLKANIDAVEYEEQRAQLLGLSPDAPARLPGSLKPDISLKDHQRYGVSWLQHLWRLSPTHCRGALLGDDMGLGKTIQLLTFIAASLEDCPC